MENTKVVYDIHGLAGKVLKYSESTGQVLVKFNDNGDTLWMNESELSK